MSILTRIYQWIDVRPGEERGLWLSFFGAMLITVAVLFLAWPKKDLYYYVKFGEVPLVFIAVSIATLLTTAYINLRCGIGEAVRDDFPYRLVPMNRDIEENVRFCHAGPPCLPPARWSRIPSACACPGSPRQGGPAAFP